MHATYNGLIYKADSINYGDQTSGNNESNNRIINLPPFGDSLTVLYGNHRNITGAFKGIKGYKSEFELMVFNNDLDKTDHIKSSSVSNLSWNGNPSGIQNPNTEKLFMKYQSSDLQSEIALSKLKHLNTSTHARKNTFTKIGLGIDLVIGTVAFIGYSSLGGLDFGD